MRRSPVPDEGEVSTACVSPAGKAALEKVQVWLPAPHVPSNQQERGAGNQGPFSQRLEHRLFLGKA